jgi:gas vesicle protein
MSSESKSSGLLLGTLIGGAVGAVSALLLAPKTGEKLREELSNKYRVINERMQQMAAAVGERSKDIATTVGEKSKGIAATVSERSMDFAATAEQKKDQLTTQIVNETHKIADQANRSKDNVVNAWKTEKEDTKRDESTQRQPQPFSTRS